MTLRLSAILAASAALAACATAQPVPPAADRPHAPAPPGWRQHDIDRPQPPRVEPADGALPVAPPSDAVVLIGPDGDPGDHWQTAGGDPIPWTVEDGALVATPGSGGIQTREAFGDVQVHIEWMPADEPEKTSQNRSNSGLFLADGRYEIQILDVWDNPTYADGRACLLYTSPSPRDS